MYKTLAENVKTKAKKLLMAAGRGASYLFIHYNTGINLNVIKICYSHVSAMYDAFHYDYIMTSQMAENKCNIASGSTVAEFQK